MKKRYKMSKFRDRVVFRRGSRIKRMNLRPRPMRGGTRL